MKGLERRYRAEDGQDLVEYALVLPVLMLLVLSIIEFSLLLFSYSAVATVAREGARAGIIPASDACDLACIDAAANAAAQTAAAGLDTSALTISIVRPTAATIQVTATYNASLLTAQIIAATGGSGTISLQASSIMNTE